MSYNFTLQNTINKFTVLQDENKKAHFLPGIEKTVINRRKYIEG